jgi:CDP-diacylglycerol---serine O-phosphatidyltransferase
MTIFRKSIPNALTLMNLLSGFAGILFWQKDILFAASCIYLAMVFDFFDGFSARLLMATSETGKELDSLSDLVSFGILPSCILFGVLYPDFTWVNFSEIRPAAYLLGLIPVMSAIRLARFNLDVTQRNGFKGLPTPANAFWIAAVPFIVHFAPENSVAYHLFSGQISILIFAVAGAVLLVIPVPLMALKFKNLYLKENFFRYGLVVIAVVLFLIFKWTGIPMIILLYILLSLVEYFFVTRKGSY